MNNFHNIVERERERAKKRHTFRKRQCHLRNCLFEKGIACTNYLLCLCVCARHCLPTSCRRVGRFVLLFAGAVKTLARRMLLQHQQRQFLHQIQSKSMLLNECR